MRFNHKDKMVRLTYHDADEDYYRGAYGGWNDDGLKLPRARGFQENT